MSEANGMNNATSESATAATDPGATLVGTRRAALAAAAAATAGFLADQALAPDRAQAEEPPITSVNGVTGKTIVLPGLAEKGGGLLPSVASSSAARSSGQGYIWNGSEWVPEYVAREVLNSTYGEVEAEGAITPNLAHGNVIAVRMKGNLTIEPPTGARTTDRCYFRIENGAVTAHTLKLSNVILKPNGEPPWNTTAGAVNTFTLVTTNGGSTWELATGPAGPEGKAGNAVYPWQINELLGWSHDPVMNAGTPAAMTAGVMMFVRMAVTPSATLTDLLIAVQTVGKTLTASENRLGVYKHNTVSKEGILIAQTADQSTAWESTGVKTAALTAVEGESLTLGNENHLFVGILANGSTMPVFAGVEKSEKMSYFSVNLLPETGVRIGQQTEVTGVTALPTSYKLTTAKEAFKPIWVGCK
jgi:hypothetical protein